MGGGLCNRGNAQIATLAANSVSGGLGFGADDNMTTAPVNDAPRLHLTPSINAMLSATSAETEYLQNRNDILAALMWKAFIDRWQRKRMSHLVDVCCTQHEGIREFCPHNLHRNR